MNNNNPSIYGKLCSWYYDLQQQYASPQEVDFYASFIQPEHRVLEAMSGSGRLHIPLMQRGFVVDGVDSSKAMLNRCRQRCTPLNLAPKLYEQQLQKMNLEHMYDLVIIAMGSFQLIADAPTALQALQKIHAHLHKGGTLLLDIFVPSSTEHGTGSITIARIDEHQALRFSTQYTFYPQQKRVDAECVYELLVDGMVQEQEKELMQFAWYSDAELAQLLKKAGFNALGVHETFFGPAGTSRIVQAVAV